jgi:hypothetical protein
MALTSRQQRPLDRSKSPQRDCRLIIIATEGQKTEKQYFSMFGNTRVQVIILPTEDGKSDPKAVLARIKGYQNEHNLNSEDELWLVIDVDKWPESNLSEIARQSKQGSFKLAISNPCFEVWLLCHFQNAAEVQESIGASKNCSKIEDTLKDLLGGYNKSNLNCLLFKDKIEFAIQIAKELDIEPKIRWTNMLGTRVYRVVQSILK